MKTQELYALVFAARYLDIFINFISLYNTIMKFIFLGSSFSIVWYMRRHKVVRRSYDKDQDTFRHVLLVLPCLLLALLIHERFTFREVFEFPCLCSLESGFDVCVDVIRSYVTLWIFLFNVLYWEDDWVYVSVCA